MKIGIVLLSVSIIMVIGDSINGIFGSYNYEKKYESYWNLADKASTIEQKSLYINKFVEVIENSEMKNQYNAVFLQTPNNSFDYNLEALKSLQKRLNEIKKIDITSFQYQTAIQQITAQEQGEAKEMMEVFKGIWWKTNHFFLWGWVLIVNICFIILFGLSGLFFIIENP